MNTDNYKIAPNQKVNLSEFPTEVPTDKDKDQLDDERKELIEKIDDLQYALYAENKQALLIIFQGIDTAGKDSSIRALFSGLNPAGIDVSSFKSPSNNELEHDYLWRHELQLPERGKIKIFNRSHYENVLVTQVHKEYILRENLPNIDTIEEVNDAFFETRYTDINNFEAHLINCGTHVLKFFLNISKEEQKKRFLSRMENPEKNYKFSIDDFKERELWDKYQLVFEKMLYKTSPTISPWYVIPSDNKSAAQLLMANIIYDKMLQINPIIPQISAEEKQKIQELYISLKDQ